MGCLEVHLLISKYALFYRFLLGIDLYYLFLFNFNFCCFSSSKCKTCFVEEHRVYFAQCYVPEKNVCSAVVSCNVL